MNQFAIRTRRNMFCLLLCCLMNMAICQGDTILFDDFNDGSVTNGTPATWQPLSGFDDGQFVVAADYLDLIANDGERTLVAHMPESELSLSDVSVRTQFRSTGLVDGIGVLTRTDFENLTAYDTGIGYDDGRWLVYSLWQNVPNEFDLIHEEETPLQVIGEDVVFQVDVFGDSLSVFAWPAGEAMPDDPIVSVRDERSTEGGVGIYSNPKDGSVVGFQYVRVADTPIRDATGDFDADGSFSCDDIDLLYSEASAATHGYRFDMTNDALVNDMDINAWLEAAGRAKGFSDAIVAGDTNLDGRVDASDLNGLAINWQSHDATSWCQGDFNHDSVVNATDLNELAVNWQRSLPLAAVQNVPETSSFLMIVVLVGMIAAVFRRAV